MSTVNKNVLSTRPKRDSDDMRLASTQFILILRLKSALGLMLDPM